MSPARRHRIQVSAVAGSLAVLAACSAQDPALRLDFDRDDGVGLSAGCGGATADWHVARSIVNPKDGTLRARPGGERSCLPVPGSDLSDGAVAVSIDADRGTAGVVLRYADPDNYVGIELDLRAGAGMIGERAAGAYVPRAPVRFEARGEVSLVALIAGDRLTLLLDGQEAVTAFGLTPRRGLVGPLVTASGVAEFDDLVVLGGEEAGSGIVAPARLPGATVGVPYEARISCLGMTEDPGGCVLDLADGTLPAGLALDPVGRLAGIPEEPFDGSLAIAASRSDGHRTVQRLGLRIKAVDWPRFPFVPGTTKVPAIAVLYTPDDISQNVTLEKLGSPDRLLFLLHRDHPELRISMMSCPENRYIGPVALRDMPRSSEVWRRLATDPGYDWIELGGHGLTHAPEGDENLDHHEFSVTQSGCNVDHARLGDREYCTRRMAAIREAYRAAGIPDDRVVVMRFPGHEDSPEALRAAARAGFLAILGSRHTDRPGREWWVPRPGGAILEIEYTSLKPLIVSAALEEGLAAGTFPASEASRAVPFLQTLAGARARVAETAAQGGILNLFNHWWETFEVVGGVMPRYLLLDSLLDAIREDYRENVWYPSAGDLALWLDARRHAGVTWTKRSGGLSLTITPPPEWSAFSPRGLDRASLTARLPAGCDAVREVRVRSEGTTLPIAPADYAVDSGALAISFPLKGTADLEVRCAPVGS